MKVDKSVCEGEVIGIKITSENEEDEDIISRFWKGGAKVNAIHRSNDITLEITFKDLIVK